MGAIVHTACKERNHSVYQRRVCMRKNVLMKDDYKRLLLAAKKLKGWDTPSDICQGLTKGGYEVSAQVLTNWKARGVSKEGRLYASKAIGCRPDWIETGEGRMEDAFNRTYGLSDVERQLPAQRPNNNLVEINQYDAGGRMGNGGLILQDQPGTIRRLEVSKEWLNQNVKGVTPASQLCIVTGFGDSMKPMYNPGDPLLVDISIKTVEYDAVYFFRVGDEGFIKRIQRIPGQGLKAISANRDHYEPWTITEDMDFEVLGRVLKVWKGDDF